MLNVQGHSPTENGIILHLSEGAQLLLGFVAPDIVRVRLAPAGEFTDEETFVVERSDWPAVPVTLSEAEGGALALASTALRVEVSRQPLALRMYDPAGRLICATPDDEGVPALAWDEARRVFRLALTPKERIYGLGQGALSTLELRGKERRMWQEWDSRRHSGNAGIPLALSTAGYGLLLNTSWPSRFIIGEAEPAVPGMCPDWAAAPWPWGERVPGADANRLEVSIDGGQLDAFIIYGRSFDDILKGYGVLTGFPPLPPLWAFGLMQCKNRYRDQSELLHIAREYRARALPCDVLVIDWHWFERFGDLEWWEPYWPNPAAMLEQLRQMGFRVMQAHHPFLERNCKTYREFAEKGFVAELAGVDRDAFDHSNPQARAAWWEKVRPLFNQGIRAYWTDMGELERHPVGTKHYLGPRERVHNIYSLLWAKGLYEGQRADSDKRVLSLMRTAYAGIQRYGAIMWSGDIDSSWDVLRDQVVVGQQVCMSGQPFWTTDIGGFFSGPMLWAREVGGAFMYASEGLIAELFARWFQWGAFCPIFRTHGTRPENEPWSFGPEVEAVCRRYITLRYRLLPYIYSCAWHTAQAGRPFMRAMVMDFPDDLRAVKAERQFMFGPSFLVAPITEPGARSHPVYLPAGVWFDFWTGQRYEGGQTVEALAPLDRIPLFVRAGSVVPFGPEMLYADEKRFNPVEVHVYPGGDGSFDLYEDDGDTYAYANGAYTVTPMRYQRGNTEAEHKVQLGPVRGAFDGMLRTRSWRLLLHDVNQPQSVRLGGVDWESWSYDPVARTLTINLDGRPASTENPVVVREAGEAAQHAALEQARRERKEPPVRISVDTTRVSRCRVVVNAFVEGAWGRPPTPVELRLEPPDQWTDVPDGLVRSLVESGEIWHQRWTLTWNDRVAPSVAEARLTVRALSGESPYEVSIPVWLGNPALSQWLLVGPFDNPRGEGFSRPYPPEQSISPNATYVGKHGAPITWHRHVAWSGIDYVLASQAATGAETVAYATTQVWSPEERLAQVALRGEGRFRLWWNQEEIISSQGPWLIEPLFAPVSLHAGWNSILVKLVRDAGEEYAGRDWAFRLDVVDMQGAVLPGLRYRLPLN